LLLELSPTNGDNYTFRDFARTWAQFPVTLNGNGILIQGSATSNLDVTGAQAQITYNSPSWSYQ